MKKAFIKYVAYCLPDKVVTNEAIVNDFPEWSVEKITEKVGVNQRHVAAEDETATDLAEKAAIKLIEENNIDKEIIDFVILCTQSPDYFLPTSACLLQTRLGLRQDIGAFDFNLGCSGYVYGLSIAKGLIAGGIAENVLLLTAETYNKYLHPKDKGNRTIFGDAASATLVSVDGEAEVLDFALGTNGKGANNLIVKSGASRLPEKQNDLLFDKNGNPVSSDHLFMNGAQIFAFTQRNVPKVINEVLEKNNLAKEDIDMFVLHQANRYMLDFLRNKMDIPEDKFYIFMENVGNTVSNSIPLCLVEAHKENRLKGNVLLCGFGVGYSWGAVILKM
ncbi:MAG: ketoacyl-ACP synthase III [Muribaculaceae bacterium]|nr:ketoacyl-ACP synthase III [Muribaculaceae bacterium]